MRVQYFSSNGARIFFQDINRKKYKGLLLPGSDVIQHHTGLATITLQDFESPSFGVCYRIFELFSQLKLFVNERQGLRLEALLSGEIHITNDDKKIKLKAGHYHLTDIPLFSSLFRKSSCCNIFITYFSKEFVEQSGLRVLPCSPLKIPGRMDHLIKEMLRNSYGENLRNFYYENCVRELLFFHLAQDHQSIPGELENRDIAAIYEADEIIASNLQQHFTIGKLSRLAGTNEFKLKKGFKDIFGMGVFHRLLFRRMERAKVLLETTDKSIGEIAQQTGYDTAAGFIHAFRREFNVTPREWRRASREEMEGGGQG